MTPAEATSRTEALRHLEHEISVMLRRIRRIIAERAQLVHPALNATGYSVMGALLEGGAQRASELADLFALDKGAVSRVIHQLLDLGLVERQPDPSDGRASLVRLTPLGGQRMEAVAAQRREVFAEKLSSWAPGDLEQLNESLARYNATLADRAGSGPDLEPVPDSQ